MRSERFRHSKRRHLPTKAVKEVQIAPNKKRARSIFDRALDFISEKEECLLLFGLSFFFFFFFFFLLDRGGIQLFEFAGGLKDAQRVFMAAGCNEFSIS